MTDRELDKLAIAMEALRASWAQTILRIVARELDDALAHAQKAVTDRLRRTDDGRPTVRLVDASPSYRAAVGHLDELLASLAGPREYSLDGWIRTAREAFYRRAFDLHFPHIPEELLVRKDPKPTQAAISAVRGAALHGMDPRKELEAPIESAKRGLHAAVALAANRTGTERDSAGILQAWRKRAGDALGRTVLTLLSDSVEYADNEARADLIHPDFQLPPTLAAEE